MLRFEDERVFRCRANARSLRRMIIKLTRTLDNGESFFLPTISEIVSSDANEPLQKLVPEVRNINPSLLIGATARTNTDESSIVSALSQNEHPGDAGKWDLNDSQKLNDKNIPYGCSSFDRPISYYITVTKKWLMFLCEKMLKQGYSYKYIKNMLTIVRTDTKSNFPLTRNEFKAFERSIIQSKDKYYKNHHIQTDGVYAMSNRAYELMRSFCMEYLRAVVECEMGVDVDGIKMVRTNNYSPKYIVFCYLYLMMYHTGKRISDICSLSRDNLQQLFETGDLAVLIPKTDRIGRITVAHSEDPENFRLFLRMFVRILDTQPTIMQLFPFDQFSIRRQLNRIFKIAYEKIMENPKPNGLSFHSLRRRKAGTSFRAGTTLESIRESLDHKSSAMTNVYINKFLLDNKATPDSEVQS